MKTPLRVGLAKGFLVTDQSQRICDHFQNNFHFLAPYGHFLDHSVCDNSIHLVERSARPGFGLLYQPLPIPILPLAPTDMIKK